MGRDGQFYYPLPPFRPIGAKFIDKVLPDGIGIISFGGLHKSQSQNIYQETGAVPAES